MPVYVPPGTGERVHGTFGRTAEMVAVFERLFEDASPSARSMRAGPEYRLAMLRVLGRRALATALARRDGEAPA